MAHYLIFGDSITYGEGDLNGGWVQLLRESLTLDDYVYNLRLTKFPGSRIYRTGVNWCGSTTRL